MSSSSSARSSDVSSAERAASAFVGYALGAVVVVPLDRWKTLMQVAAQRGEKVHALVVGRHMASQGIRGIYQGAYPHMLIAPFTVLYYSVYDELMQRQVFGSSPFAPLGAAVCARTLETTLRMPLELVRTQMQAATGTLSFRECIGSLRSEPPRAWFRGYIPTLMRDVPFSAIYWGSYEQAKQKLSIPEEWFPNPGARTFVQGFTCGALAGMVAALSTTPTDVIKTVRQHQVQAGMSPGYREILNYLFHQPRCAFAGVGPRLVRIPLGLATMMSGIEATRWAFEQRRLRQIHGADLLDGSRERVPSQTVQP
eukprot:CAMPEP_0195025924 /NCGR_PEP_ID=MMETSP0326_2-20130528/48934_1 /TAXON_ID=2866 ORGANISM="Crypthecodinium cohnii, Strain Seligo" /NCGR_SAMPLE_ID=MMETSP0326_2 /ASSEMBLY_ACC=CAM_ASM_000348 /LENGTH=310 /DNA_ID=CAMNT_0040047533 /DNA_START=231 /DNA_END=1160 /DNA_ORIENTATION=-